jgi:phosphate transport system substrate-binding protein
MDAEPLSARTAGWARCRHAWCWLTLLALVAPLAPALSSCARTPAPTPTPVALTIAGAEAMAPLLAVLAEQFEARQPNVSVIVQESNSARGLAQVVDGQVELAALAITPPESAAGGSLWAAPIAADGIAIVVHAGNPLQNLTLAQLYDVYYGRTWQWSELGVAVAEDEITVISREEGSATRAAFEARVMTQGRSPGAECTPLLGGTPAGCEADPVTTMAVLMPSNAAVLDYVAAHPGAMAYLSAAYVGARGIAAGELGVRAIQLEGAPPEPQYVAGGRYPLSEPFFLVAAGEPTGAARQFVDFVLGTEGQRIVGRYAVPVRDAGGR